MKRSLLILCVLSLSTALFAADQTAPTNSTKTVANPALTNSASSAKTTADKGFWSSIGEHAGHIWDSITGASKRGYQEAQQKSSEAGKAIKTESIKAGQTIKSESVKAGQTVKVESIKAYKKAKSSTGTALKKTGDKISDWGTKIQGGDSTNSSTTKNTTPK